MRKSWNQWPSRWLASAGVVALLGACDAGTGVETADIPEVFDNDLGADTLGDGGGSDAGLTNDTAQGGTDSVAPGSDAGTTGSDAQEVGTDAVVGSDAEVPGTDAVTPGSDAEAPGTDVAEVGSDAVEPGTDTVEPGTDAASMGSDTTGPDIGGSDATVSCTQTNEGFEACDGLDNDCDGETDEGASICGDASACATTACVPCVGSECDGPKKCLTVPKNEGQSCGAIDACVTSASCQSGTCLGTAVACDDGVACTTDDCDPATGCTHVANNAACDDSNVCTDDVCDLSADCTHTANTAPCDDNDACTLSSACTATACVGGEANLCDDGVVCTVDACDPASGCSHTPTNTLCYDGADCTSETCDAVTGCKFNFNNALCDDGGICTTDSCGVGGCVHEAQAGCDPCTQNTDCNDGNYCTTDACSAGKCTYTAMATCPTNYVLEGLTATPSPVSTGSALTYKVNVSNYGLVGTSTYSQKLRWNLILSKDDVVDASDLVIYTRVWGGYNVSKSNPSSSDTSGISVTAPASFQHKYACAQLVYAADGVTTDNTICVPVEILSGEAGLVYLAADSTLTSNGDPTGTATANLSVGWNNPGTASHKPALQLYLSNDGSWDAQDKLVGTYNNATVAVGSSESDLTFSIDAFNSTTSGKQFVCLRADAVNAVNETNPDDNVICAEIDVTNKLNLWVDTGWGQGGPFNITGTAGTSEVLWGQAMGCSLSNLLNAGTGIADTPFAARCFLAPGSVAPGGTVPFSTAEWSVSWDETAVIPGALPGCQNCYGKGNIASPSGDGVMTATVGSYNFCVEANYLSQLPEVSMTNNLSCRPITVKGGDLFAYAASSSTPAAVSPGGVYQFEFSFGNKGNIDIVVGSTKMKGRILLSADQIVSEDDLLVWEGEETAWASYSKPSSFQSYYSMAPNYPTKLSFTMPTAAPGNYYFLLIIDADDVIPEPTGNNMITKAVTVNAGP